MIAKKIPVHVKVRPNPSMENGKHEDHLWSRNYFQLLTAVGRRVHFQYECSPTLLYKVPYLRTSIYYKIVTQICVDGVEEVGLGRVGSRVCENN